MKLKFQKLPYINNVSYLGYDEYGESILVGTIVMCYLKKKLRCHLSINSCEVCISINKFEENPQIYITSLVTRAKHGK